MKKSWKDLHPGDIFYTRDLSVVPFKLLKKKFINWIDHKGNYAQINILDLDTQMYSAYFVDDYVWNENLKMYHQEISNGLVELIYGESNTQFPSAEAKQLKCTCGTSKTMGNNDQLLFHSNWCDLIEKDKK